MKTHIPGRILIVDDNVDASETIQMLLEMQGYETCVASGGADGIVKADSFRPQIILSDLRMPGMSGTEMAVRLREDERFAEVYLIAISGWCDTETAAEVAQAGFNKQFSKPLDFEALITSIQEYFKNQAT